MKDNGLIFILALFILLIALIFTTPFMDAGTSNYVWIIFFGCISLILIIWIIMSFLKNPKVDSKKSFKNQPAILQILEIIFIIAILYETIVSQSFRIAGFILFLIVIIKFATWFFKKEE